MKTPDEIKKGLEVCASGAEFGCIDRFCPYGYLEDEGECCDSVLCDDALEYIQQLEAKAGLAEQYRWERDVAIDQLEQLGIGFGEKVNGKLPRWISVEERLPEDDENVLVYCIGNNESSVIAMTSYTHRMHGYNIEGWRSPYQYFFYEYNITHWTRLPEPPEV